MQTLSHIFKYLFKEYLPERQRRRLHYVVYHPRHFVETLFDRFHRRFLQSPNVIERIFYRRDLTKLATLCGTDKWNVHWYAQHYQKHFAPLRRKRLNILEIGIGGYEDPKAGGESLRMWKIYFPKSTIYGIDLYDKTYHEERRIKTFCGNQAEVSFLEKVAEDIGQIDIIIDDGSHENDHVIATFKTLFPKMNENGIYVIEDLETSYWPEFRGTNLDLDSPFTIMGFLKSLTDGLHYHEYKPELSTPTYFEKHIIAIHFYHNLVFIYKGLNNEGLSLVGKKIKKAAAKALF